MKSVNTHRGAALLMLLFAIMFLVVAGRFLYIETTAEVEGVDLNEWAEDIRTSSYEIDATRGKIYDKNGMVLAYDRPTYRMYAIVDPEYTANPEEPRHVTEPEETASTLAPLLDMEASVIAETIKDGLATHKDEDPDNNRFQVEFGASGKNISQSKVDEINELELPGIQFIEESKRYYPNGMFASHVIGFARSKEGNIQGVTGIEKQMEEYLKEEKGRITYERDKYGTKLLDPNEVMTDPDNGEDVHLTLDQKIQTFLEDAMSQVDDQYSPEKIMAAVMDPDTGEVLAMSNRPSYNPNAIGDVENWYNDIISYPFEVGSPMKIFTWAAAIEEGVYQGTDLYKSGTYRVTENSKVIGDHNNGEGWDMITYNEGFQRSSNVAASKLVYEVIGPTKFKEYLTKFHLDQKSGIDLPGELDSRLVYNRPIEYITTGFGQGSIFTPIQLMTAATAVANDGKMMKPYMLSKITSSDSGEVLKESEPEVIGEPISSSTAEKVRELMGTVVTSENGTGQSFKLQDFSLAGKTGTAQIPSENGGYMNGRENYVFSFMGMAPAEDPELLLYVAVKQPELEPTELGSEPVSYIVRTVMENSLHYLDIQPDKDTGQNVSQYSLPDVTNRSVDQAKTRLSETFENVEVIGTGNEVVATLPAAKSEVLGNQKIMIVTDQPTMPDLTGYSLRDVHRLVEHFNLQIEAMGNGFVNKQSISPGSPIKEEGYLVVELSPPASE
ncbi:penicillin-binding protein [Halobacillus locisalis]|uniref:serine-type D-Ala-D-Ala carboxypeptidase n=1 Tax=Halobacillus locisalis TaxID=220753 RepID=A0A838CQJ9_9BACI|nr:penicillin-binding protein [Halobacillus locisalis]MBA2174270.1 penicillin-binding protein [Halobacillus locisalis]